MSAVSYLRNIENDISLESRTRRQPTPENREQSVGLASKYGPEWRKLIYRQTADGCPGPPAGACGGLSDCPQHAVAVRLPAKHGDSIHLVERGIEIRPVVAVVGVGRGACGSAQVIPGACPIVVVILPGMPQVIGVGVERKQLDAFVAVGRGKSERHRGDTRRESQRRRFPRCPGRRTDYKA